MRNTVIVGCIVTFAHFATCSIGAPAQGNGAADIAVPSVEDVPASSWAYSALAQLQAHKVLVGYPKGYFDGKRLIDRGEFTFAVRRIIFAIIPDPETPDSPIGSTSANTSGMLAKDLQTVRKIALEFKPELVKTDLNWKSSDEFLRKLQDKKLHADIVQALAEAEPKAGEIPGLFESVNRPSWVYDAIQHLSRFQNTPRKREMQIRSRFELAVTTKRYFGQLDSTEPLFYIGKQNSELTNTFELEDVVDIHKLVRSFQRELVPLGADPKMMEQRLSKMEDRCIAAEEEISVPPPTAK